MTTYTCPKGHSSETDDFCDTCGAKIDGVSPPRTPVPQPVADCPNCGAPRAGGTRFCEDCGYDHDTGKIPVLSVAPPVVAPVAAWTATIAVDREYFEDNAIEGVDFPDETPSRTVALPPPQLRIGRRSSSKGTNPEIDLSDTDPGVSHSHALLTLSVDGVWLVSDLGSTNGTYVNGEQQAMGAGQSRALKDGDQVHVGAWTTITLHAPI
ncbi:FHA domain-containing protein [Actinoplanes sp. TBRC 11911]|uniref:FHA domain-containing protein n=1 Tax=Actinoplanes sp. TBRC 11911 TaxID=2729386 RepID=UPI00145E3C10|nr:FHA domain-containing protein [Actinoplanes sp. TBRC 11911]NMO53525.1 FHA domain-containing protein [Actinoplanes sp. TBRC 11911]